MKRLLIMFLICIFNISFAQGIIKHDGVKYVSKDEAEQLWDFNITLNERSGLIKIKKDDKSYYMQIDSKELKTQGSVNILFSNINGFKLKGDRELISSPIIKLEELYLPVKELQDIAMGENEYDVIVVGSDPEGISAAVSASRMGAKVLLLGKEETPGGLLVHGMLNTLDMNYSENGELLTQGIFSEFYSKIDRKESFDIKLAEKAFNELISEDKVKYIPNIKGVQPILNDKTVIGISAESNDISTNYYSKIVIDATTDGDICALSGAPFVTGMEDINIKDTYMAVTLVLHVGGVDWAQLRQDVKNYQTQTGDMESGSTDNSVWAFGKWCYDKYTPVHNNMKLRGLNVGKQDDGTILINALQILGIDGLNEESKKEAQNKAQSEGYNVINYLKTILPSFKNAYLLGVADDLYIRETRHIQGEYMLMASELLEGVIFPDAIASGSYPIDIQSTSTKDNGYVIGKPDQYTIPYRCIVPKDIENLYIVGKAASYSSVAAGSTRVVPVGMAVGESSGIAAVYSIMNDLTPRQLGNSSEDIKKLKEILTQKGVYVPEYAPITPIADTKYYKEFVYLLNLGILGGGYNNNFKLQENVTEKTFTSVIIKTLKRSGIDLDYESIEKETEEFNTNNEINFEKASKILSKIIDTKEKTFEYMKNNGYFGSISLENFSGQTFVTNELLYEIAYTLKDIKKGDKK